MSNLTSQERQFLHRFLTRRFNLSELKTLAFYLAFPFEEYPHETISEFARELLQYYEREDALGQLLKLMLEERPDDQLAQIYAKLPAASPRVKVELVIRNAVTENAQDIQERIARAMGWRREDVGIIWAVPGSLKLLLSVPADKVPALLSLARDRQAWLPYEVESMTPYEQLPQGEQVRWRNTVMEQVQPTLPAAKSGFLGLSTGRWIAILLVAAGVAVVAVGTYLLAPRLEILNACGVPLPIPPDVPVIGGQALAPGERVSLPIPTGRYLYVYDGEVLDIDANGQPLLWPVGGIEVLVDGRPLLPGEPDGLEVGWGEHHLIEILRCR